VQNLTKFLFVSHGELSKAMISSAEMIAGDQSEAIEAIGLYKNENPELLEQRIRYFLEINIEQDVLVFTDLVSGTPFNVVGSLMQEYSFGHISGINLALLLEALLSRDDMTVKELLDHLTEIFPSSVMNVNALMGS